MELTASDSLVDKLDRARALLSHTRPGCDIADVIEQAVTMLVERLETKRFGARRKKKATTRAATTDPRTADRMEASNQGPLPSSESDPSTAGPVDASDQAPLPSIESDPGTADPVDASDRAPLPSTESGPAGAEARPTPAAPSKPSKPSRYVPAQVRRAVYDRDGARCAHIDTEGRRCTERDQLEIDHIVPWARGGPSTLDNLRLACRGHNAQAARQAFGAAFIDRRIERRRETQRVAREERQPDDGQWSSSPSGARRPESGFSKASRAPRAR